MKIAYWVADFGNSTAQHMMDGNYFEMPSSIKEITETDFEGMFAHDVHQDALDKHLVIKMQDEQQVDRYYIVGKKSQAELLGNAHIHALHDKTTSMTVWVVWLASLALYHASKHPDLTEDQVEVDYFGTLLPVWLVKKATSFNEKLSAMAERFRKSPSFELLTPGFKRTLQLKVNFSECRVEGENARHALKYDLEGNYRDQAKQFMNAYTVINDIGGQSQDKCKLQPGLSGAQSADDFSSSTDQSYLSVLEKLRNDKLMDYFNNVRALETFILEHIYTRNYVYKHPVTHDTYNLTTLIDPILRSFAKVALQNALQSFSFKQGDTVYYVHIGGVNQALQAYMQEYLESVLGKEVASQYHIFPDESRKLNIFASAIVAKNYIKRQQEQLTAGATEE